jgi:hypothetical protein
MKFKNIVESGGENFRQSDAPYFFLLHDGMNKLVLALCVLALTAFVTCQDRECNFLRLGQYICTVDNFNTLKQWELILNTPNSASFDLQGGCTFNAGFDYDGSYAITFYNVLCPDKLACQLSENQVNQFDCRGFQYEYVRFLDNYCHDFQARYNGEDFTCILSGGTEYEELYDLYNGAGVLAPVFGTIITMLVALFI